MVEVVLLSLTVGDGLFKLRSVVVDGMMFVGVGWHVWVSLVVVGLLFEMELMVVSLMVSVGLFRLDRRLVAVGWQL